MRVQRRMLVALVALASLALVLIPAGSARELRVSGTAAIYTDATGDAKSAPDVSNVGLDLDPASGALTLEVNFANNDDLSNKGALVVLLNTDRNSGTGDQTGADYVIAVFGDGMVLLKWNGADMALFNHQPMALGRAPGKLLIVLCSCDLGTQTFDFTVVGLRGDDVDLVPDSAPASFPAQETAVSIESMLYIPKPLFPKSGKRFTVNVSGVRLSGSNEIVAPDSYSCSAKLGAKALKGTGSGGCSWPLPKKARGKKLTVSVNVSYQGDSETFSQTYKVR